MCFDTGSQPVNTLTCGDEAPSALQRSSRRSGPASSTPEIIRELFDAGADVFRLNFSHGEHDVHEAALNAIRAVEKDTGRPIGIIVDLQGPKLRIGELKSDKVTLEKGALFTLDSSDEPGDETRAPLPHPELFQALQRRSHISVDDGRIRLQVERGDRSNGRDGCDIRRRAFGT